MRECLLSHVFIQRYMRLKRRYMPPPESLAVGPASGAPLRISDRGLLAGPRPAEEGAGRQSHPEVDAAEEAGFEWISFDTRMTRDRAFVTIGDVQLLELGDGVQVNVEDVTREQLETLRRPAPSIQELLRQQGWQVWPVGNTLVLSIG